MLLTEWARREGNARTPASRVLHRGLRPVASGCFHTGRWYMHVPLYLLGTSQPESRGVGNGAPWTWGRGGTGRAAPNRRVRMQVPSVTECAACRVMPVPFRETGVSEAP